LKIRKWFGDLEVDKTSCKFKANIALGKTKEFKLNDLTIVNKP
jgi:hypothetical protein